MGIWVSRLQRHDCLKKVPVLVVQGPRGKDATKRMWGPESGRRLWLEDLAAPYGKALGASLHLCVLWLNLAVPRQPR